MMRIWSAYRLLTVVAGAAVLSACVSVLPEADPAPARFSLQAGDYADAAAGPVDWSLIVADPMATRAYDTVKIAVAHSAGRLDYYKGGEWSDRAPTLLRTAIVRTFENSGRILNVGGPVTMPIADYTLQTDVRAFHIDERGGGARAAAEFFIRITDRRGRVVAAKKFVADEPVDVQDPGAFAEAFNVLSSSLLRDVADWTFDEVAVARRALDEAPA
ncbi:MAG: ABC-type transport auxiliary lipoprotein family protein [Pseudomonadota bacterium]